MTTPSPARDTDTVKTNEAQFWFCVVEATDSNGKLDYKLLADMAGYKNRNSAKAVFFGKRKQMRALYGVKIEDGVTKEREKGNAGVNKRSGKKKVVAKRGGEKSGNECREEERE